MRTLRVERTNSLALRVLAIIQRQQCVTPTEQARRADFASLRPAFTNNPSVIVTNFNGEYMNAALGNSQCSEMARIALA